MAQKQIINVILSCESKLPYSLIDSVDTALTNKLVDVINNKKQKISETLLESKEESKKEKDPYEKYEPKIREAIDYTVESCLEGGLELENTIKMASKQYNVHEEKLQEYFDLFLEEKPFGYRTNTSVVSTSSNDEDDKRGLKDDEDTNKRVRYESLKLDNGQTILITEEFWNEEIEPVLKRLNEANQDIFINYLKRDKLSFIKATKFCRRVVKT
jgi:hypothetical protein